MHPGNGREIINDDDKNSFMATIHGLDRSIGLVLILHTPGGDIAAVDETKKDPAALPIWQVIIGKYHPTLLGECRKAILLSGEIVQKQLEEVMFSGYSDAKEKARKVVEKLLTVHHCYMHTFANSAAIKIVENQKGIAVVSMGMNTR